MSANSFPDSSNSFLHRVKLNSRFSKPVLRTSQTRFSTTTKSFLHPVKAISLFTKPFLHYRKRPSPLPQTHFAAMSKSFPCFTGSYLPSINALLRLSKSAFPPKQIFGFLKVISLPLLSCLQLPNRQFKSSSFFMTCRN